MTERRWLTRTDPSALIKLLPPAVGQRKLRLFAVACCRRLESVLRRDQIGPEVVEWIETYADRGVSRQALLTLAGDMDNRSDQLLKDAWGWEDTAFGERMMHEEHQLRGRRRGAKRRREAAPERGARPGAESQAVDRYHRAAALRAVAAAAADPVRAAEAAQEALRAVDDEGSTAQERIAQLALLRDIFGNPYRPLVVESSWLEWDGGIVRGLTQSIYEERAFDRLPLVADALEAARCTDVELLTHCRATEPHVRGCWAVDLLTGKK